MIGFIILFNDICYSIIKPTVFSKIGFENFKSAYIHFYFTITIDITNLRKLVS